MKKVLLGIVFLFVCGAANTQQVLYELPPWMNVDIEMDSLWVIESDGQNHRVLTVLGGLYQDWHITYNRQTHKSNFSSSRQRLGGYIYKRLQSEGINALLQLKRDSAEISTLVWLGDPLTTPIDTSDLVPPPPPDTTGN